MSIRSARKNVGLTQKELAEKINVDQSTVAMWECGRTAPRYSRLSMIASVLNCTIDELFKSDTEKTI